MTAFRLEQSLKQNLSREQQLALKQLFALRYELRGEPPPEALRGLEGIGEAHKILEQKKLRGVLIGSLAGELWKTGDQETLNQHKDVDVAVLPEPGKTTELETFEGGIDWWMPRTGLLKIKEAFGSMEGTYTWWENGNGIVIGVGLNLYSSVDNIPYGLSIPTPDKLIEMRILELLAKIDQSKVTIDDGVIDALNTRLEKELNPKHRISGNGVISLAQFVPYRFQLGVERIPEEKIQPLYIQGKEKRELVAINSHPRP